MPTMIQNQVDGPNCYCAGYVIPADSGDGTPGSEAAHPLRGLRGTPTDDSVQTLSIVVDHSVPYLTGSVTTADGSYPTGVNVTLTDPAGNVVQPNSSNTRYVVCVDNDPTKLWSSMIQNPQVGTWTATVTNADSSTYVYFGTMPTANQYPTITSTLAAQAGSGAPGAAPEGSASCWICKAACWAVAIALAMLIAAGLAFLTAEAAGITALVALIASAGVRLTAQAAVIILQVLIAGGATGVGIIVANMCSWVNACPTGVTAAVTQPTAGTRVSGTTHVSASATNATTVSFYVAQQTLIGTDNTGPNWDTNWDTTKFTNGGHTVWALATGAKGAAWSAPVNVTVDN